MRIIAGTARSRTLQAPKGTDTRPTLDRVRENLFNILGHRVWQAQVLDLFAGSGALSFEAVSRGAARAVLVDHARAAHLCEQKNAESLGFAAQCRILLSPWERAVETLRREDARFDLVFLDPPYALSDLTQVTQALLPLLAEDARVVVEHEGGKPSRVCAGLALTDTRKYGYAGISIFVPAPVPAPAPAAEGEEEAAGAAGAEDTKIPKDPHGASAQNTEAHP